MVFKGQKNKKGPKGTKSLFSEVAWSERVNPQENKQDIKESTADKGGGLSLVPIASWRSKENPLQWKERKERESCKISAWGGRKVQGSKKNVSKTNRSQNLKGPHSILILLKISLLIFKSFLFWVLSFS